MSNFQVGDQVRIGTSNIETHIASIHTIPTGQRYATLTHPHYTSAYPLSMLKPVIQYRYIMYRTSNAELQRYQKLELAADIHSYFLVGQKMIVKCADGLWRTNPAYDHDGKFREKGYESMLDAFESLEM